MLNMLYTIKLVVDFFGNASFYRPVTCTYLIYMLIWNQGPLSSEKTGQIDSINQFQFSSLAIFTAIQLMDTMLRYHGNIPGENNQELHCLSLLPSSSSFHTAT